MTADTTQDQVDAALLNKMEEYNVSAEEFPLLDYAKRLSKFYEMKVAPLEKSGAKIYHEYKLLGDVLGFQFIGFIDLLIDGGDWVQIIDFKTGKTVAPLSYAHQLMLYAYLYGKEKGWSVNEIADKARIFIFFPLGSLAKKNSSTPEIEVENTFKEIEFSGTGLGDLILHDKKTIEEALNTDWESLDPINSSKVDFSCNWCPYMGATPNDVFEGCPKSYMKGKFAKRGTKWFKRVQ
jgi:hypothetical protein